MSGEESSDLGVCGQHGPYLYFCRDCHSDWLQRYPRTADAIGRFVDGKGSRATVAAARKADEANACHHCGRQADMDGDHTCACPYSDADCPDHRPAP